MNPKPLSVFAGLTVAAACFFAGWVLYDRFHSAPASPAVAASGSIPAAALITPSKARLVSDPRYAATPISDARFTSLPYAPGWPLKLPGEIVSSPTVADLLGDGHLEVIVSCRASGDVAKGIVQGEPLLYAFTVDGKLLPGWPAMLNPQNPRKPSRDWHSAPSVFRRGTKDELAVMGGGAGPVIVRGDGSVRRLGPGCDWHANIPLVDLDGDGVPDVPMGRIIINVDGGPVKGWPGARRFRNGYAPCVADAFGDERLELFHLFYTARGSSYVDVGGFDSKGYSLPGWPKKIDDPSWYPTIMGNILGNGQMQVVGAYGSHVFLWNADGSSPPHTTSDGPLTGILKDGIVSFDASPSLADLDGDGKPEIVLFEEETHTLRAWHGDGTPAFGSSTSGAKLAEHPATDSPMDGVVATIPGAALAHGVSVASLGDDPKAVDFFLGTSWVRRLSNGRVTITRLVPSDVENAAQPTICDLEGDGTADVIFGTVDGNLYVYKTKLACRPDSMQWPTANGNFQHTGAWHKPSSGR